MRPVLLLLFFFLSVLQVAAQPPGGQGRDSSRFKGSMKDSSFMKNMAPVGKVIGILRDSSSKEAMEFASVVLMKVRDSSVAGVH
ncbi:MAG: hypothetical protein IPJ86_06370 [Bacteroidetes bacterium]|nr:hypothetical protein [Bacteroidota bacterium]